MENLQRSRRQITDGGRERRFRDHSFSTSAAVTMRSLSLYRDRKAIVPIISFYNITLTIHYFPIITVLSR